MASLKVRVWVSPLITVRADSEEGVKMLVFVHGSVTTTLKLYVTGAKVTP